MMRRIALIGSGLAILLALAACGNRTSLTPPEGKTLPVAPYGATQQPDSDALLTPPAQAAPERSVELRRRSEQREDDPFELPPEG